MSTGNKIRPIVIGVITNDDKLFVFEGRDEVKDETFYRPIGGAIEFSERGEAAVRREYLEEINAELINIEYLTTLENIFTFEGRPYHEIVLVYNARFQDKSFYGDREFTGHEDNGIPFKCLWIPLRKFKDNELILYPDGLLNIL